MHLKRFLLYIILAYVLISCKIERDKLIKFEYMVDNKLSLNVTLNAYSSTSNNLLGTYTINGNSALIIDSFLDKSSPVNRINFNNADSIIFIFSDGKRLTQKCISNKISDNGCNSTRNILTHVDKVISDKSKMSIVYEITNEEYIKAQ